MIFYSLIILFHKEYLFLPSHFNKYHSDKLLLRKELPLLLLRRKLTGWVLLVFSSFRPIEVSTSRRWVLFLIFQFEEEAIVISEAEEEADEYLCVQTPSPIVTYVGDSSDEEEMAPKTGPGLRDLMKNRNKAPSPKDKNKSKLPVNPPPPPPQLPADLGLKPNPDLRRKRYIEAPEEGEMAPSKGSKQPRQSQDQRGRRSTSIDSREEPSVAQVRRPTHTWSPKLEVDGVPIAYDASLRHYRGGHAGHVAKALE